MSLQFKKFSKFLPLLVIVIGLLLSIYSGWFTYHHYQEKEDVRLESASNEIVLLVKNRMAAYEQVLRSGIGLFNASDSINRNEWAIFVKEQKLNENFKGIQAFGYSEVVLPENKQKYEERIRKEGFADFKIHPEGERELYISITYLEPFADRNLRAFGYDMFSEKVRIESLTKTIQSGEATLSGKIKLAQEDGKDIQAGLLMTLPIYKKGFKLDTPQERTLAIQGFVYAVFRANDLMNGILGTMFPNIDVEIYDGDFARKENMLYDSSSEHKYIKLYKTTTITISGRTWTLLFQTNSVLESENIYITFLVPSFFLILTLLLYLLLNSLIKTKENALEMAQKATEKFRSLVESTNDWIWEVDSKGIYTYVSPQAETLLGYKTQEIIGKSALDFMSAEEAVRVGTIFKELADKRAPLLSIKNTCICKDGSIKILETRGAPFFNENGKLLGYRGIDRDITERSEMEKELKLQEEMMLAQSKQAAMGDMIAMIAHQWRQPLAVMSMDVNNLSLSIELEEEITTDYLLEHMRSLSENIQQLSKTIDDFRNFFKPSQIKKQITIEDALNDTLNIIGTNLANSNISLNIHNTSKSSLFINKSSLIQVLLNIIGNAKEALLQKEVSEATININAHETKETVTLSICDNGGGIPEAIIDKIDQPYFTTKEEFNGTGLGLYISHMIIKKHLGGTLTWHNDKEGACFVITLDLQHTPQENEMDVKE